MPTPQLPAARPPAAFQAAPRPAGATPFVPAAPAAAAPGAHFRVVEREGFFKSAFQVLDGQGRPVGAAREKGGLFRPKQVLFTRGGPSGAAWFQVGRRRRQRVAGRGLFADRRTAGQVTADGKVIGFIEWPFNPGGRVLRLVRPPILRVLGPDGRVLGEVPPERAFQELKGSIGRQLGLPGHVRRVFPVLAAGRQVASVAWVGGGSLRSQFAVETPGVDARLVLALVPFLEDHLGVQQAEAQRAREDNVKRGVRAAAKILRR